jgi:LacI family transcriptional regulator
VVGDRLLCGLSAGGIAEWDLRAAGTPPNDPAAAVAADGAGGELAPVRVVERPSTDVVAVADARVAQALRYIREHVGEGIDVSDVRRAVPMSRTLLERKFKKALGHSPHRQIVQQRIERAKHFLAESEVSIAVVADLAGFADASYLSVAFRRETGESPYAYRAQQRTGR